MQHFGLGRQPRLGQHLARLLEDFRLASAGQQFENGLQRSSGGTLVEQHWRCPFRESYEAIHQYPLIQKAMLRKRDLHRREVHHHRDQLWSHVRRRDTQEVTRNFLLRCGKRFRKQTSKPKPIACSSQGGLLQFFAAQPVKAGRQGGIREDKRASDHKG